VSEQNENSERTEAKPKPKADGAVSSLKKRIMSARAMAKKYSLIADQYQAALDALLEAKSAVARINGGDADVENDVEPIEFGETINA